MSGSAPPRSPAGPTPPICIVIPTYNRMDALPTCLHHLEQQTWTDFEVVVVDDGSSDRADGTSDATPQFLQQYAASGKLRLRFTRQPNSGPAAARNRAVSLTQSPLCLLIGDDIFATPTFVATHLEFHRANPDKRCAAIGLTRWSESEQTVTPFMRWLDNGFQFDYNNLLRGTPPGWGHFYTSNLSIKTGLLRRHPFDERFRCDDLIEDGELSHRLHRLEDLRLTFLPNAVAEHLHPTDLRRACRRAIAIGRSYVLLEHISPGAHPPKPAWRLFLRELLGRCTWLLAPSVWLLDHVCRIWCPNPFLQPVLSLHAAVGRRKRRPQPQA